MQTDIPYKWDIGGHYNWRMKVKTQKITSTIHRFKHLYNYVALMHTPSIFIKVSANFNLMVQK